MTKPLGYYASALSGTTDAAILGEIEELYGSHLQGLTRLQKSVLLNVLMAFVTAPEEIENIPNLKDFLDLSNGAKLSMCNAIINALLCGGEE